MRIAIIGGGIAGMSAALALKDSAEVTLYERAPRLGGHANTLTVDHDGVAIPVDTGFMVYNQPNYPELDALLRHLNVATRETDMSFSVSGGEGIEWSSRGLAGLFAWKRNLASPHFLCMLGDIVRFSAQARLDLQDGRFADATLRDYITRLNLGQTFVRRYLVPMGAAIWSSSESDILAFPAESFLRFFDNHRLLHLIRPQWRTVIGGSQAYVRAIAATLGARVRVEAEVVAALALNGQHLVRTRAGRADIFDQVIFACHADEALTILGHAHPASADLASIRFAPNVAYLHRDARFMPKRAAAWAAWNYLVDRGAGGACVTYWMNRLQHIDEAHPVFVTLNPAAAPAPDLTFARLDYAHPQFDVAALHAQKRIAARQGENGIWFAGAWLGYGFHEDGLRAALAVASRLGADAPWRARTSAPPTSRADAA